MESRSEHSPPEKQTWNATYFTPQPPGTSVQTEAALASNQATISAVCAQVREQLNSLLENDGSVRPETATALYGHIAYCPDCAREFQEMQRVVNMLEGMPLAELPTDYSRLVMRRIQTGNAPPAQASTVQNVGLCDRVRDKLQPLLDKDAGIGPELTAALYGHIAICKECASEFSAMRSMVNLLETMPAAELPIDYSAQIMRRIQTGGLAVPTTYEQMAAGPSFAASSIVSGGVATHETHIAQRRLSSETQSLTHPVETRASLLQRLIASVALSGMFVYLLASDWGRQMLGVNVEAARLWLTQIGRHLEQAPLFGGLVVSLSVALAGVNDALGHAFSALGGVAAQTLALEVSLGLAAYMMVNARRRATMSGI